MGSGWLNTNWDGTAKPSAREPTNSKSGVPVKRVCTCFGWKPAEVRLPSLRDDIQQIVDRQSETNPQFRNHRLYTCLTPGEVRRQLIAQKGDTDAELPCEEGIRQWLNRLGYPPKKVQKSLPQKKSHHRGYFRAVEPSAFASRVRRKCVASFAGCQSHSESRRLLMRRQEPGTSSCRRP